MKAFRCSRTGVLYPADYVEQWGRKYGIGLGPIPVSEALINNYDAPIAEDRTNTRTMHPIGNCHAQVDWVDVTEEEFQLGAAILHENDPDYIERAALMRHKQLLKSPKMQSLFPDQIAAAKSFIEDRTKNLKLKGKGGKSLN